MKRNLTARSIQMMMAHRLDLLIGHIEKDLVVQEERKDLHPLGKINSVYTGILNKKVSYV